MDSWDVFSSVVSGITLLIVTGLSGIVVSFIKEFRREHKALIESQRDEIKGQIIGVSVKVSERGYITHTELEYVNDKFHHYENLHGNTYVDALVKQMNNAIVKGDPIPKH